MPIHHYAEIDFNGFEDVVNALGGVEVDVPMAIDDPGLLASRLRQVRKRLMVHKRSCSVVRVTPMISTVMAISMRAANQRMVISAILKKIMSSDVATMTNTVNTLAN